MTITFELDQTFIDEYVGKQPNWGPLGYVTYKRTYARPIWGVYPRHFALARAAGLLGKDPPADLDELKRRGGSETEEYWLTCVRVVEGTFSALKDHCLTLRLPWDESKGQEMAKEMFRLMWEFKFLPPGRGLWAMGSPVVKEKGGSALNNPLHEDTRILTKERGWVPIRDIEGQKVTLLSSTKLYGNETSSHASSPIWTEGTISHAEIHPCLEIELIDDFKQTIKIIASENHRWFRKKKKKGSLWERVTTLDLCEGDYLPIVKPRLLCSPSKVGMQHGLFFGDGTRSNGLLCQFSNSQHLIDDLFDVRDIVRKDDRVEVRNCPTAWGFIPQGDYASDKSYVLGFLQGYFAADGCVIEENCIPVLASARVDELSAVRDMFELLGIRTTKIVGGERETNFGKHDELYSFKINKYDLWPEFFLKESHRKKYTSHMDSLSDRAVSREKNRAMVKSVRPVGYHRVLCATVPEYEQFVIDGFILTSNCAFVSTEHIDSDFAGPFCFLMDMSMLGVGVGGDTRGAEKVTVVKPKVDGSVLVVPDTREGWVALIRRVLNAYVGSDTLPSQIDYSNIRPRGEIIRTFGGTASGPQSLMDLVTDLRALLDSREGQRITSGDIVDIFNLIGRCVVAGNTRRSAEIMFGDPTDELFLELKDPIKYKRELDSHRWASNNSVFAEVGQNYTKVGRQTAKNGEPGYYWLENAQKYGRMGWGDPDWKDRRAMGGNPCFSGDTLVAVADGRHAVSFRQLAEEGRDVPVYSLSPEGEVQIKWGRNPRLTRQGARLLRVHLDDGSHLDVTPDHGMLVRDGSGVRTVEARELQPGDSLPRFEKFAGGMVRKDGRKNRNEYWTVHLDPFNMMRERRWEHRLIAKFHQPERWNEVYGLAKANKWAAGGLVIHHRDYDGLNNSPVMTHAEHCKVHARDMDGEKNPTWGKTHSEESKKKIDDKTLERCADPEFRRKLSESHSEEERRALSERMARQKADWNRDFYLKCEEEAKASGLETLWIGERLYVIKNCCTCRQRMVLAWRERHKVGCSISCVNSIKSSVESRRRGQRESFDRRHLDEIHRQVSIFKDLKNRLGRSPMKKEMMDELSAQGVMVRLRDPNDPKSILNWKQFVEMADGYNHRVVNIEELEGEHDVFNITVDDNYTFCVVTTNLEKRKSGIITNNCLEQTLESHELCCLVETFPALHKNQKEYLHTLKYAYLYAKVVTLIPHT